MGDYHFVYKDLEGASTQWDDIQRKLGNLPPKAPAFKPPPFTPASDDQPKDKTWIDSKTSEELEDLEDNLDDDRFLQEYRKKRLAEMQEAAKVLRFGSVIPISGSDFVREVSQAPSDVWVVVILYKEGIPECGLLMQSIEELAVRYPSTKFVKIISTDCIPNYPDRNLPTLLVYNNGAVKGNYVGLHSFGRRCTPEECIFPLVDERFILNLLEKKKRLAEMQEAAKVLRFGSVIPISGSDFVREVSQAPSDVWVVVILYKEGIPECGLLMQSIEELALRYPSTKFVKIISTDCIPNYPDRNLPTLLVYNNGAVKGNYVGLHSFGRRCTPEGVALVLCQSDPVLNDGHNGNEAIIEGVRKRFIEKVVADHEEGGDDDYSSD
ncbi:Viral IAP-associated factor like [Glycine soja]|uniref:Viral IAP-associated factor like n=1 Tax=Glycine soja TaxID=3848 RepID=A0A0B2QHL0_GLYSO|nr:Viral IAP-associated factor like [Glycine soja]